MKYRYIGTIIVGFSLLIGIIILLFNNALTNIVETTCSHGSSCSMWTTINTQTTISIIIMVFVLLVGLYFIYLDKTQVKKKDNKKDYLKILNELNSDEKTIYKILINKKTIYQSNLVKQTNFSKVKITRILDDLESKKLIKRERRGMTNLVVLLE